MLTQKFSERKMLLLNVYLLCTVVGSVLGGFLFLSDGIEGSFKILLIMPLMQFFVCIAGFKLLTATPFLLMGVGALVSGILFFKQGKWAFLFLFGITILLLSVGGVALMGIT